MMTGITATTTAPAEVKRLFDEYAGILEMYANDQRAMTKRFHTVTQKRMANLRAELYAEIAKEMQEIVFNLPVVDARIQHRPTLIDWHCTCCSAEFEATTESDPACPHCKAAGQYTYPVAYFFSEKD